MYMSCVHFLIPEQKENQIKAIKLTTDSKNKNQK